jgi:hypothetical protein
MSKSMGKGKGLVAMFTTYGKISQPGKYFQKIKLTTYKPR